MTPQESSAYFLKKLTEIFSYLLDEIEVDKMDEMIQYNHKHCELHCGLLLVLH